MAEIRWIKLSVNMFDDEKIKLIRSVPEGDSIIVVWIQLLSLAGKTNDDGMIYIARNLAYSDEMLATIFNHPLNTVRLALQTLERFKLIETNPEGVIHIKNWDKHQNIEGMDKVRKLNAERNKRYRERKKQEQLDQPDDSDVSETSRDGTDIDLDLDLELEEEVEKETNKEPVGKPGDIPYIDIINYLNHKAGKEFKATTAKTRSLIKARWNEGFTLEDFKRVIDNKVADWKNDQKWSAYLRPATLFNGDKFEGYLNEVHYQKKEENNGWPEF